MKTRYIIAATVTTTAIVGGTLFAASAITHEITKTMNNTSTTPEVSP